MLAGAATALVLTTVGARSEDPVRTGSPAAGGATLIRYKVDSRFVHRRLKQVAALPPGAPKGRPLLVFLHGRGLRGQESSANEAFFKALAAQGSRAPAVVFPNGGESSYWHRRAAGTGRGTCSTR